jgi:ribosomal protein S6
LNSYELAMIISPTLSEKDAQKVAEEAKELLLANGASAISEPQFERRAFAYPVKKHTEGTFAFISFDGPAPVPSKIRFEMRHREGLLRMAFVCKPAPKHAPAVEPAAAPGPEASGGC